ncbi:unnamed protein product, partial [Ectocarpus fasciculatus]
GTCILDFPRLHDARTENLLFSLGFKHAITSRTFHRLRCLRRHHPVRLFHDGSGIGTPVLVGTVVQPLRYLLRLKRVFRFLFGSSTFRFIFVSSSAWSLRSLNGGFFARFRLFDRRIFIVALDVVAVAGLF